MPPDNWLTPLLDLVAELHEGQQLRDALGHARLTAG